MSSLVETTPIGSFPDLRFTFHLFLTFFHSHDSLSDVSLSGESSTERGKQTNSSNEILMAHQKVKSFPLFRTFRTRWASQLPSPHRLQPPRELTVCPNQDRVAQRVKQLLFQTLMAKNKEFNPPNTSEPSWNQLNQAVKV